MPLKASYSSGLPASRSCSMEGLNAPRPRENVMISSNCSRRSSMSRAPCGRLHFGHAVERKRAQRLRLDNLFDVGAGQTADGAKGRIPQQFGPLHFLNFCADLTGDAGIAEQFAAAISTIRRRRHRSAEDNPAAVGMGDDSGCGQLRADIDNRRQDLARFKYPARACPDYRRRFGARECAFAPRPAV